MGIETTNLEISPSDQRDLRATPRRAKRKMDGRQPAAGHGDALPRTDRANVGAVHGDDPIRREVRVDADRRRHTPVGREDYTIGPDDVPGLCHDRWDPAAIDFKSLNGVFADKISKSMFFDQFVDKAVEQRRRRQVNATTAHEFAIVGSAHERKGIRMRMVHSRRAQVGNALCGEPFAPALQPATRRVNDHQRRVDPAAAQGEDDRQCARAGADHDGGCHQRSSTLNSPSTRRNPNDPEA